MISHRSAVNNSFGMKNSSTAATAIKATSAEVTVFRFQVGRYFIRSSMKMMYSRLTTVPHTTDIFDKYLK